MNMSRPRGADPVPRTVLGAPLIVEKWSVSRTQPLRTRSLVMMGSRVRVSPSAFPDTLTRWTPRVRALRQGQVAFMFTLFPDAEGGWLISSSMS